MHPADTPSWRTGLLAPALGLIAGLGHAASLTWPWPLQTGLLTLLSLRLGQPVWWLEILSLGMLAYLLQGCRNWRAAALLGWFFASSWLAATVGWTFVAMHTYGGLSVFLSLLAVLVLAGLMALFYAAACGLFAAFRPGHEGLAAALFSALWLLAELARGTWLSGFGWGASAYAHVDGPLAGYAPWLGVYGLCAIAAWLAMVLAQVWHSQSGRRQLRGLAVAIFLIGVPLIVSWAVPAFSASGGYLSVTLLQGNVPQDEKFELSSGVPLALEWYAEQLQHSQTALVVAPETAIALLPQQLPTGYWEALQRRFGSGQQAALVGIPLGDHQQGYTNSVLGLKPEQTQAWRYDKQHLVPFGEFIPPFFKWFTAMMNIPLGEFNRGDPRQPPFAWQGQRLATNICYENLFGEELAAQFADPALMPTLFVNISNLAWFGNGLAVDQHLQIARMRALEFERAFVLATNTGFTAIVDHRADVLSTLARDTRGVLVGEVEGRTGITPYAWWVARFGLWPMWLLALALLGLAARGCLTQH
jgi:apolipoprotein N-acyltransferase